MRPRTLDRLSALGGEALSFARQALLMPRDLEPVSARGGDAAERDLVVVLHGLFATAGPMRPIRRRLERDGARTLALTYEPGPGVEQIASRVADALSKEAPDARVHLVGHSLGGVVARFYAERAADPRVVQTVSLASPFAGVRGAALLGFGAARDLDPGSALLREIRLSRAEIPHLSVVADADTIVRPPLAHALPGGDVVIMRGRGHAGLLFCEETHAVVSERVLRRTGRRHG